MELIVQISITAGAITAVSGLLLGIYKTVSKLSSLLTVIHKLQEEVCDVALIKATLTDLESMVNELYLDSLRKSVMSPNLPHEERLSAGKRYLELGGNGAVSTHYKVMLETYEDSIKGDYEDK